VPAVGWLTGWSFRRPVIVNNANNPNLLTDYQVLVVVDTASLILQRKLRADCSDIRFTDSDGTTLLPYWIEGPVNASNTKIWVKVPFIPANGTKTIYCYSPDTDILTEDGWVNIQEFVEKKLYIKVATLNPNNSRVEYHYPTAYFKLPYKGKLLHQKGKLVDFMVTPNHRIWARPAWKKSGSGKMNTKTFSLIEASKLPRRVEYMRYFPYEGEKKEYFTIPSYEKKRKNRVSRPPKTFPMNAWLRVFGIYIAEGCIVNDGRTVVICQQDKQKRPIIKRWIEDLGYRVTETPISLQFHDVQVASYLKQFGHAHEKFIPKELKNLSKEQLRILLEALLFGDGSVRKGKDAYYATISERLANDVQEVALKAGFVSTLRQRKDGIFIVSISEKRKTTQPNSGDRDNREWVDYEGYVYCIEVSNHIIYVRRNGKPHWNGNCYYGNPTVQSESSIANTFIREIAGCVFAVPMDEGSGSTVYDQSGNNNNGTVYGANWTQGRFGGALNFDGIDDWVLHQTTLGITGNITVEAWVKTPTSWANAYPQIISDASDSDTINGFNLYIYRPNNNNQFGFVFRVVDWGTDKVLATFAASLDTWYHVVGVRQTPNIYLYINGVLNNSKVGNSGPIVYRTSPPPRVEIGTKTASNAGSTAWKGIIDEVRVYNRALSSQEIADLYNNYGYVTTSYAGKVLVRKRIDPEPITTVGNEEVGYATRRRPLIMSM
jgi:hypothetical protein